MGSILRALLTTALLALAAPVGAGELLVSAAASLTNAVTEVGAVFEAENPGDTVTCNFAGSGTLVRQLEQGAPVDVFLSADQATMDGARRTGLLLGGTQTVFATNTLVLITGQSLEVAPNSFLVALLAAPEDLLLAVGNPKFVPAGRYARQALGAERWNRLQGRLVLGSSVRQVLDYVSRREVGAGVVYATDALAAAGRVRVADTLSGHDPILYPASVVATSKQPALAGRFITFLLCGSAQSILSRHGFGAPPAGTGKRTSQATDTPTGRSAWTSR